MAGPDPIPSPFRKISRDQVLRDPFPYVCIENFLDDATYRQLAAGAPPLERVTGGAKYPDDFKLYWQWSRILADPDTPVPLRRILESFASLDTFHFLAELFGPEIAHEYPSLDIAAITNERIGMRGVDTACDAMLEAQFLMHAPIHGRAGAERTAHAKGPDKLFEGALCMRRDEDDAEGGDFRIYRVRPGHRPLFGARGQIDIRSIEVVRTIPRRRNTFVLWLNTPRSITDLSPRGPSPVPSVYLNFLIQLPYPLFKLPKARASLFHLIGHAVRKKLQRHQFIHNSARVKSLLV